MNGLAGKHSARLLKALALGWLLAVAFPTYISFAQDQQAAADVETIAPEPLNADELEILAARIALYPDELVAVIAAASLYPLQIVEPHLRTCN